MDFNDGYKLHWTLFLVQWWPTNKLKKRKLEWFYPKLCCINIEATSPLSTWQVLWCDIYNSGLFLISGVFHTYFPMSYCSCLITLYLIWSSSTHTGKGNHFFTALWFGNSKWKIQQIDCFLIMGKNQISFIKKKKIPLFLKKVLQKNFRVDIISLRRQQLDLFWVYSQYNYSFKV